MIIKKNRRARKEEGKKDNNSSTMKNGRRTKRAIDCVGRGNARTPVGPVPKTKPPFFSV